MTNWRVLLLAAMGFLILLSGLVILALPAPYEGGPLYTLNPSHGFSLLDLVGLGVVLAGGAIVWGAGWLWQRWMGRGVGSGE